MRIRPFIKPLFLDAVSIIFAYLLALFPFLWLDIYFRHGTDLMAPSRVVLLAFAVHIRGLMLFKGYQTESNYPDKVRRVIAGMVTSTLLLLVLTAASILRTHIVIMVAGSLMATFLLIIIRSKEAAIRVAIVVVAIAIMLIPFEIVLRSVFPQPRFSSDLPYYPNIRLDRTIDIGGVKTSHSIYSTNEFGFRGNPPPANWKDAFTIITVGGSTTIDGAQEDHTAYPAILANKLSDAIPNVWVNNAGINGHTTRGNIRVMDEVIRKLKPNLVIIVVGANDLSLSFVEDSLQSVAMGDLKVRRPDILQGTQLGRMAWNFFEVALGNGVPVDKTFVQFTPIPMDTNRATFAPDNPRDALPQLPEYHRNLNKLIDLANEIGTQIVFLTQPSLFDDTPYWAGIETTLNWVRIANVYFSAATNWKLLNVYNQELLAVCPERCIP